MQVKSNYRSRWDVISIGASLACAVHCVVLPVLFTTLPLFGIEILENIYLELLTIFVTMGIGGWALWKGYHKIHRHLSIVVLFLIGLAFMISGNFFSSESIEMSTKMIGAILIIIAHIRNWQLSKNCKDCHPENRVEASAQEAV
jgi:drug/metabolite transporter (DMT)-like permease